jgi:hypothetical protein
MRRTFGGAAAAVAIAIFGVPSATAATQLGETFNPTAGCAEDLTILQTGTPANDPYAAPFAGVITSWSYQAADAPQAPIKFKVGRPAGGNNFTIVAEDGPRTPARGTNNTFLVRIPVQAGDVIGTYDAHPCGRAPAAGYAESFRDDDTPPGTTAPFFGPFPDNVQLDVSATLEPDCDSDGFGDETQDVELPFSEACGKGNRALTLDANKNKVRKGKKVRLSGRLSAAARQGPCESGQTVEMQRKRPKRPTFTTFAQVQTDAQGSFSLKKKLKKTFEFRAQIVETATCTAALSNSEKVKVKKKK